MGFCRLLSFGCSSELPSFAMWAALPPSDYYDGSETRPEDLGNNSH
jgi:hypothetical protein